MNNEIIIEAKNLCKTFKNGQVVAPVIKNLNIKIYKNEFTVIMGTSGSGKSTLLHQLSALDKPTSGDIFFSNEKISSIKESKMANFRQKKIGFIFQSPNLLENLNVLENVVVPGYIKKVDKDEVNKYGKNLLQQLDILEHKSKYPSQLSGGQQQRVAIARSMINKPEVIFADEPTGALNSSQSKSVLNLLQNINKNGQTIVMVTHDLKTACSATRIIYLENGKQLGELDLKAFSVENQKDKEEMVIDFLSKKGW